jgi:hypothetical protein
VDFKELLLEKVENVIILRLGVGSAYVELEARLRPCKNNYVKKETGCGMEVEKNSERKLMIDKSIENRYWFGTHGNMTQARRRLCLRRVRSKAPALQQNE